jgi:hypothetical protein
VLEQWYVLRLDTSILNGWAQVPRGAVRARKNMSKEAVGARQMARIVARALEVLDEPPTPLYGVDKIYIPHGFEERDCVALSCIARHFLGYETCVLKGPIVWPAYDMGDWDSDDEE